MPTNSTKPTWIEPPPPPKRGGMGCFAKGCLFLVVFAILIVPGFRARQLSFLFRWIQAYALPVEELPPAQLSTVQQRVDQFEAMPPAPLYSSSTSTTTPAAPDVTPPPATPRSVAGTPTRPERSRDQRPDFRESQITRARFCLDQREYRHMFESAFLLRKCRVSRAVI